MPADIRNITVLGSTGSIGVSTLDVVARHPERYKIFALTAHTRVDILAEQCARYHPEVAVVGSAFAAQKLSELLKERKITTQIEYGDHALCVVASAPECHIVMAAIVGAAGLAPTLAAAKAGKKILLANKEALVMSGQLFMDAVSQNSATLLPIDSEHNAIFQCLPLNYDRTLSRHGVAKILLTASGGPFLRRPVETLSTVTPEEAIAHPNWIMGKKISVDSATMMNKGLEIIEAHWLFGASSEKIEVVIHPQSVIHSMVSYVDGSVLAQLGHPDMRTPIAHALAYPERMTSGVIPLDFTNLRLDFEQPDFARFPCLALAYSALKAGGTVPAILNAANEVAVQAFLDRKIGFKKIDQLIARVLDRVAGVSITDIAALVEQDHIAREVAMDCLSA